jgi:hypothetical protein
MFPPGRDATVFAYIGRTIALGGMPYRDAWDIKPPGIYLIYALLGGGSGGADERFLRLRIADIGLAVLVGACLRALAGELGHARAGLAAAVWFAGLYLQGGFWGLGQTETWANLFALISMLASLRAASLAGAGASLSLVSGLSLGIVLAIKFTSAVVLLPCVSLCIAWAQPAHRLQRAAWLFAGALVPPAACAVWLAGRGALGAYADVLTGFVAPYARVTPNGPAAQALLGLSRTGSFVAGVCVPVFLAAIPAVLRRRCNTGSASLPANQERCRTVVGRLGTLRGEGLLWASLASGVAAVWMQGKFFLYHWQAVLPFLAILAAIGLCWVLHRLHLPPHQVPAVACLVAICWSLAASGGVYRDFLKLGLGVIGRTTWLYRFGRPGAGGYSFLVDRKAAEYVREVTYPGDGLLVWGFEPAIYLLADRYPPGRFFFNVPVAVRFAPTSWRREFVSSIRARPPRVIVVAQRDAIPWANGLREDSSQQLAAWPELAGLVQREYRPLKRIADLLIYHRRSDDGVDQGPRFPASKGLP